MIYKEEECLCNDWPAMSCEVIVCDARPPRQLVIWDIGCYKFAAVEIYVPNRMPAAEDTKCHLQTFKQPNFFSLSPEAPVCISFYSWQFGPLFHLLKDKKKNPTCCASPTVWSPFSSPTHTPVLLLHRSQSSSHPPAPRWRPGGGRTKTPQRCQLASQTLSLWNREQIQMRFLQGVLLLTNVGPLRFFKSALHKVYCAWRTKQQTRVVLLGENHWYLKTSLPV